MDAALDAVTRTLAKLPALSCIRNRFPTMRELNGIGFEDISDASCWASLSPKFGYADALFPLRSNALAPPKKLMPLLANWRSPPEGTIMPALMLNCWPEDSVNVPVTSPHAVAAHASAVTNAAKARSRRRSISRSSGGYELDSINNNIRLNAACPSQKAVQESTID